MDDKTDVEQKRRQKKNEFYTTIKIALKINAVDITASI